jgi:hypothetical protein
MSLLIGVFVYKTQSDVNVVAKSSQFPIYGTDVIMSTKSHGTSESAVQQKLKWNCDVKLADRITNYNRKWAEFAGYWSTQTSFLDDVKQEEVTIFYDSVTGKPLFKAPIDRKFDDWKDESLVHGWPSFRDNEVFIFMLISNNNHIINNDNNINNNNNNNKNNNNNNNKIIRIKIRKTKKIKR